MGLARSSKRRAYKASAEWLDRTTIADSGAISNKAYTIANPLYDYDYGTARDAAKALEIGNVDEQKEVDDILAYIQGGGGKPMKEEETVQEPSEPPVFTPSEAHQGAKSEYESTRDNPIPRMSDQIGANAMADAIRHGDDLNDWYQRDTKARAAEAKLGAYEMESVHASWLINLQARSLNWVMWVSCMRLCRQAQRYGLIHLLRYI